MDDGSIGISLVKPLTYKYLSFAPCSRHEDGDGHKDEELSVGNVHQ